MRTRRLITCLLTATAIGVTAPASASAAGTLQPGSYYDNGTSACTLGFLFSGGGGTYFSTAAHCADDGNVVYDIDGDRFGTFTFVGDGGSTEWDFAFIRVDSDDLGRVSAAMKGQPGYPRGGYTTSSQTAAGSLVQLSGYGLGFSVVGPTREQRRGVLTGDDSELYIAVAPLIFGDSGGPVAHVTTGRALGLVSRLCIGVCTEEGPTIEGIVAKAASRGFSVTLRTV